MGEYALRKADGQRVKIGTCELMYYIRYEDRYKVSRLPNNLDPETETDLFWRLPFPDEDGIRIGEYQDFERGLRLFRMGEDGRTEEFRDQSTAEDPGVLQLHHRESGLMINVKCYHGFKLPDETKDYSPFWNGKSHAMELAFVKNMKAGILPIVRCRHCGNMWRYLWADVLPFVTDEEFKKRMAVYAAHPGGVDEQDS